MKLRVAYCVALMCLSTECANGQDWINWTTGTSQAFQNSSGGVGTVSYIHSFTSIGPGSMASPDASFPFTNPVQYLAIQQVVDASIEFTFTGVSPDSQSLLTLGNLRPTNRFIVSAFDSFNNNIALSTWTNHGEYRLFPNDDAPNIWTPSTGELVGNGVGQNNSKNIFLGLTSSVARIRVDYDSVDGGFEFLDIGLSGGAIPTPAGAVVLVLFGGMCATRRRR